MRTNSDLAANYTPKQGEKDARALQMTLEIHFGAGCFIKSMSHVCCGAMFLLWPSVPDCSSLGSFCPDESRVRRQMTDKILCVCLDSSTLMPMFLIAKLHLVAVWVKTTWAKIEVGVFQCRSTKLCMKANFNNRTRSPGDTNLKMSLVGGQVVWSWFTDFFFLLTRLLFYAKLGLWWGSAGKCGAFSEFMTSPLSRAVSGELKSIRLLMSVL